MSVENIRAFPAPDQREATGGMTLRDYFAAALAPTFINLLANHQLNGDEGMTPAQCASKAAYTMADAMLAERAK